MKEKKKKPVEKNSDGNIKVKYSSKYPKAFSDSITVYHNVKNVPVILTISGEVILI